MVQVGMMKVNVKRSNLQLVNQQKQVNQTPVTTIRGSNAHISTQLDLRGERYEEALQKLEKYIDDALLAGYATVSIIHGKGTGVLRKGVQQFCKTHPRIGTYRDGKQKEGG